MRSYETMRWFLYIILGGLMMACKTVIPPGVEQPFVGTFTGDISGTPTVLTLTQPDTALAGVVNAGGYIYTLSGSVRAEVGRGVVYDPQTEGSMAFELVAVAEGVELTFMASDSTGQVQRVPLLFSRQTETPETLRHREGPLTVPERDSALVGLWSYYDYSSFEGGAHIMRLDEDGVYYYKNSLMVYGASSAEADSLFWQDAEVGQWGTIEHHLYVYERYEVPENEEVYTFWRPLAHYYVENGRMLLTYEDGSRQVWHRREVR